MAPQSIHRRTQAKPRPNDEGIGPFLKHVSLRLRPQAAVGADRIRSICFKIGLFAAPKNMIRRQADEPNAARKNRQKVLQCLNIDSSCPFRIRFTLSHIADPGCMNPGCRLKVID